jgi:hypothetical protein
VTIRTGSKETNDQERVLAVQVDDISNAENHESKVALRINFGGEILTGTVSLDDTWTHGSDIAPIGRPVRLKYLQLPLHGGPALCVTEILLCDKWYPVN